jgi:hypothetical protein
VYENPDKCHENVNNPLISQKRRLKFRAVFEKKSTFEAKYHTTWAD